MPHSTKTRVAETIGSSVLLALMAAGCHQQGRTESASNASMTRERTPVSQQVAGARASTQRDERVASAQEVIDESVSALQRVSAGDGVATFRQYMGDARGVFIFPDVKKGALLVGGAGGRGVLLAKKTDGSLSSPAFFSISSGSVGLQLGYERSSIVLFLMNDRAFDAALDGGFQLGANASVASGTLAGEGRSADAIAAADVISIVENNGGVYAGASIEGAVIDPVRKLNASYYDNSAEPRGIVTSTRYTNSRASTLSDMLTNLSQDTESSAPQRDTSETQ